MPPTTITGVRTVAIAVSDQDRSLAFFVDTLGFKLRLDAPLSPTLRWVEVAPPGSATSIALAQTDPAGTGAPGTDTGIRFAVPDAEAEHATMSRLGLTVSDLIHWPGVPPMFTAEDPDGNRFYIVQEAV